jgi:hypothetical protein
LAILPALREKMNASNAGRDRRASIIADSNDIKASRRRHGKQIVAARVGCEAVDEYASHQNRIEQRGMPRMETLNKVHIVRQRGSHP